MCNSSYFSSIYISLSVWYIDIAFLDIVILISYCQSYWNYLFKFSRNSFKCTYISFIILTVLKFHGACLHCRPGVFLMSFIPSLQLPAPSFLPQEVGIRQFLLTNLYKEDTGTFKWRANLEAISRTFNPHLCTFPLDECGKLYEGRTNFIAGAKSDYIQLVYLFEIPLDELKLLRALLKISSWLIFQVLSSNNEEVIIFVSLSPSKILMQCWLANLTLHLRVAFLHLMRIFFIIIIFSGLVTTSPSEASSHRPSSLRWQALVTGCMLTDQRSSLNASLLYFLFSVTSPRKIDWSVMWWIH